MFTETHSFIVMLLLFHLFYIMSLFHFLHTLLRNSFSDLGNNNIHFAIAKNGIMVTLFSLHTSMQYSFCFAITKNGNLIPFDYTLNNNVNNYCITLHWNSSVTLYRKFFFVIIWRNLSPNFKTCQKKIRTVGRFCVNISHNNKMQSGLHQANIFGQKIPTTSLVKNCFITRKIIELIFWGNIPNIWQTIGILFWEKNSLVTTKNWLIDEILTLGSIL